MNDIKISVIVPVYNTEKYLKKCLESIINQNFQDIEIIIINDCSTDNSLNIIKEYMKQDGRIILVNKKINEGVSIARNLGMKLAKGEYIFYIDSDDWIEQNYFKDMYNKALQENADMVISDFYKDFDNGKVIYIKDQGEYIEEKIDVLKKIFLFKSFPSVCNKLIRKNLYLKNEILYPKEISMGEDLYTSSRLIYFSRKIIKCNKAYYHYIQNPESAVREKIKNLNKVKDIYFVVKELEEFFTSKNISLPINELKINHLSIWLLKSKYDLKDLEYLNILDEYIELFKRVDIDNIAFKKLRFFGKILKTLNKRVVFIILWHFNSIFEGLRGNYDCKNK